MTNISFRPLLLGAAAVALAGAALIPAPARAWVRGGVFIGLPPVVVGPPAVYPYPYYYPPAYPPGYYPPPAYYPPPPGYYPPPPEQQGAAPQASTPAPQQNTQMSQANTPIGTTCYAGVYTCAAYPQSHVGTGCSCPGIGAPSYGVVQ
jgi:hypothetical protein